MTNGEAGTSEGKPSSFRIRHSPFSGRVDPRCLFGLAGGGVCPAVPVARNAVRSYRTISPLPMPDCRLPIPNGPMEDRASCSPAARIDNRQSFLAVCFLWHFPSARAGLVLPTTVPFPVRTFLPDAAARGPRAATPERSPSPAPSESILGVMQSIVDCRIPVRR
jgi:hypothetical protein